MIRDYFDPERNQTIPLGKISRNDAIDRLLSHGVDPDEATDYVDKELQQCKYGPYTHEQAVKLFNDFGYTEQYARGEMRSDVYDYMYFKLPPNLPISAFSFRSYLENRYAALDFMASDYLSLLSLQAILTPKNAPSFPGISTYHDYCTENNKFYNGYTARIYFNDDEILMTALLHNVFDRLEKLTTCDGDLFDLSDARKASLKFLKSYKNSHDADFPGGNYPIRNLKPRISTQPEQFNQEADDLYVAVTRRDYDSAQRLLHNGTRGNKLLFGCPIIRYSTPHEDEEENRTEIAVKIFALLLEYGAEVEAFRGEPSLLAVLIRHGMEYKPGTKAHAAIITMCHMISLRDEGRTFAYVFKPDYELTQFEKIVIKNQNLVRGLNSVQRALLVYPPCTPIHYRLPDAIIFTPRQQRYYLDGKIIHIHSKIMGELTSIEYNQMALLFKRNPQWADQASEEELDDCLKTVTQDKQDLYVDLVRINGILIGFNIAQYIQYQNVLIHHAKLALFDKASLTSLNASQTLGKGLMFYLAHKRGFLPLESGSKIKTLTVFEAAAPASILNIAEFDYYPKFHGTGDFVSLLMKSIYQNLTHKLHYDDQEDILRMDDVIAKFEAAEKTDNKLPDFSDLASKRLFGSHSFFRPRQSIVVIVDCNARNHKNYLSKLRRYINTDSITPSKQNRMFAKL